MSNMNKNSIGINVRYFILALSLCSFSVEARMYQWVDAESGSTQLSGKPPSWYRSADNGPRVFVFDSGKLVDDTGIKVSEEHRLLLRQEAYDLADEESIRARVAEIQAIKAKQLEAERKAAAAQAKLEEEEAEEEVLAEADIEEVPQIVEPQPEDIMNMSLDAAKQLIQDWEQSQESKAKEILNQ